MKLDHLAGCRHYACANSIVNVFVAAGCLLPPERQVCRLRSICLLETLHYDT